MAKNGAEFTSVGWKVEFMSSKLGYLPEEFSKQGTDMKPDTCCCCLQKTQEEREKLKKELLSTKESVLDTLENSQPI